MSSHILTITGTDPEDYDYAIECEAGRCGWIECSGDHAGYDPEEETSPAFDQYEAVLIHERLHDWNPGYGWTIPYVRCMVRASAPEDVFEIGRTHGPGRYRVADDWDDYTCHCSLAVVEPSWPGGSSRATIDAICGGEAVPEADKRAALDGIDSRFSEARLRTILEREKK